MNNISEDINVFSNLFTTRFLIMIDFLSLFYNAFYINEYKFISYFDIVD